MLRASFRLVYTAFVAKLASVGLVPICLGIDTGMNTGLSLSPQSRSQGPVVLLHTKQCCKSTEMVLVRKSPVAVHFL